MRLLLHCGWWASGTAAFAFASSCHVIVCLFLFCLFVPQSCDCFVPEEYVIDVVYGK